METAVLTDRFPRTQVLASQDMPTYQVAGEDLVETVGFLRDAQGFDLLADLCGIDWKDRTPRFGVVIHLLSTAHKEYVRLHVGAVNDAVPSVSSSTLAPTGTSAKRSTCSASASMATPTRDVS